MQIDTLTLMAADLSAQHAFYANTLGLELVERAADRVTFQAGRSLLTFRRQPTFQGCAHLALDIPRNRVDGAEAWLRARVPLLADPAGVSRFPLSEGWNSESLYFEDAAGNILEFIARRDLPGDRAAAFSPASILHVSELGVVVPDVRATASALERRFGLRPFGDHSDTFAPVGDQGGLLIVVRAGRGWFPLGRPAAPVPFEITFSQDGASRRLQHRDLPERP